MRIKKITNQDQVNFLSYVNQDFNLQVVYGLDMTRDQNSHERFVGGFKSLRPHSNHSNTVYKLKEYQVILEKMQRVFSHFDKNQGIPVYGLGAKIGPMKQLHSNSFSLTGDFYNPFFEKSENIVDSHGILEQNSPSFFSEFLGLGKRFGSYIKEKKDKVYGVVMILTHDYPKDQDSIKKVILESTKLPVSFIFCHVYQLFPVEDVDTQEIMDKNYEKAD